MNTNGDEQPPTWVFGRDGITLRLRRLPDLNIVIASSEGPERIFSFPDLDELTAFQCGFEQHLVHTGWSLIEFASERRSGVDRRSINRASSDRRPFPTPARS